MRKRIAIAALAALLIAGLTLLAHGAEKEKFDYKQDPEIKQTRGKKPATVHIKRDDTGRYSWEIKGEDTDEVIAADKRLREYLKVR